MKFTHCKDWRELENIPNKEGMYIDDKNGDKYTFKDNEYHSYNGKPAIEYCDGTKVWYRNGKGHRLYGPAVERCEGLKTWWLFDNEYYESDYNEIMKNVPLFYWKNMDKL